MYLYEITNHLEEIAPLRFQEEYDNSGLLVGSPKMEVNGAIISLDMTEQVIQEAIDKNCNLVIAHHPIIFRGIKKFDPEYYVDRAVIKAIKNDIALYAIHTNLDNVLRGGVNEKIALKLNLQDIEILKAHPSSPLETSYTLGSGTIGNLPEAMTELRFLEYLKEEMEVRFIRHTQLLDKDIQKIAICGGSGSHLLKTAIAQKADVFITADFKYHQFFDANGEIVIIDIGHYESEYFTIELILELISKKFPKFAAHCTKEVTNPVFYY